MALSCVIIRCVPSNLERGICMAKNKRKTIGKMSKTRMMWEINPQTRIKQNKKGKGSYNRAKEKAALKKLY